MTTDTESVAPPWRLHSRIDAGAIARLEVDLEAAVHERLIAYRTRILSSPWHIRLLSWATILCRWTGLAVSV